MRSGSSNQSRERNRRVGRLGSAVMSHLSSDHRRVFEDASCCQLVSDSGRRGARVAPVRPTSVPFPSNTRAQHGGIIDTTCSLAAGRRCPEAPARCPRLRPIRAPSEIYRVPAPAVGLPWHFLYFFPEPHGHGSLRPTLCASCCVSSVAGVGCTVVTLYDLWSRRSPDRASTCRRSPRLARSPAPVWW